MTRLERLIEKYEEMQKHYDTVYIIQVITDLRNLRPIPRR